MMILLIENITSSKKAMFAVAAIPSALGIDGPITLQELKEKMKALKKNCLAKAIAKERAAYDVIKAKRIASPFTFTFTSPFTFTFTFTSSLRA